MENFIKKLKGELIDIVEWLEDSRSTLVYRFVRHQNEIKNGARLVVREGQAAVFVNEGQTADVFTPGTYTLDTANLPILSTLRGWKHGFNSPFKAEVYFVNTRQFTDLKWGTMNPIMLRDPEFGPVRLRAFGTYAIRVIDPGLLIKEIVGTSHRLSVEGLTDQLRNFIVSRFAQSLGESQIPALDLAANYMQLGGVIVQYIRPEINAYGVDLTTLLVENISLPPEVEQALDTRTKMGVIGDLNRYTQFQSRQARDAAQNPSGGGVGPARARGGHGFNMAQQIGAQNQAAMQQAATPPRSRRRRPFRRPQRPAGRAFDLTTLAAMAARRTHARVARVETGNARLVAGRIGARVCRGLRGRPPAAATAVTSPHTDPRAHPHKEAGRLASHQTQAPPAPPAIGHADALRPCQSPHFHAHPAARNWSSHRAPPA